MARQAPQKHATLMESPNTIKISKGIKRAGATLRTPESMQGLPDLDPDRKGNPLKGTMMDPAS